MLKRIPWNKGKKGISEKTRQKMREAKLGKKNPKLSEALKGKPSWNKGKEWSEKSKQKMRETHLGMKYSKTTKEKHRKQLKAQWKNGIRKGGWKLSKITKEKIRLAGIGKKLTKKTKEKISKAQSGKNGFHWKGDDVGYSGLHKWVRKVLGRPTICEHCKRSGLTGKQIHWANKSREYKRKKDDWIRLCVKCHKKYDKK